MDHSIWRQAWLLMREQLPREMVKGLVPLLLVGTGEFVITGAPGWATFTSAVVVVPVIYFGEVAQLARKEKLARTAAREAEQRRQLVERREQHRLAYVERHQLTELLKKYDRYRDLTSRVDTLQEKRYARAQFSRRLEVWLRVWDRETHFGCRQSDDTLLEQLRAGRSEIHQIATSCLPDDIGADVHALIDNALAADTLDLAYQNLMDVADFHSDFLDIPKARVTRDIAGGGFRGEIEDYVTREFDRLHPLSPGKQLG